MTAGYQPRTSIDPANTSGPELANIVEEVGFVAQARVLSRTSAEPGNPSEGDAYIHNGDSSWSAGQADDLMLFIDSVWRSLTPEQGWTVYVVDEAELVGYNGGWTSREAFDRLLPHVLNAPVATTTSSDGYEVDAERDVADEDTLYVYIPAANSTSTPELENTGGAPAGQHVVTTRNGNALWPSAIDVGVHAFSWDNANSRWLLLNPALNAEPGEPVGALKDWPTATPPTGWLERDGSAISRTTYADLFAVIGTTYGAGDGSTTFNLPDDRGRFLRWWDHGAGRDPDAAGRTDRGDGTTGDNVGTLQADQYKSHNHGGSTGGNTAAGLQMFQAVSQNDGAVRPDSQDGVWSSTNIRDVVNHSHSIGADGGNETRPLNRYYMPIIKF